MAEIPSAVSSWGSFCSSQDFSNPPRNVENPLCFSQWAEWPMLPPRWYLLLCQGHNTLETGLLLLHPETVLWSKGRGAQCSSGILKKAWSQAKQAAGRLPLGQDIPSALCLSHYCTSLSGVTTETKMQPSQYLTPSQFPIFFHYMQVPYQEDIQLYNFCLIWPLLEYMAVKIQSCRSHTSLSRVVKDTFWNEILVPAPIFPNEKLITHIYSLILA